ncbi:MAG: class I SAM-dependent methyltransferase [Ignavibacteria bacterium]|nr:class I SAM-dependent methyltransferase [Ignavibacteria bacterium]
MNFDPKKRFSDRVENYVKYRPHYPEALLEFMKTECGLDQGSVIADVGSGTGISSELFLYNGNKVYAVEPNDEMRSAAEKIFSNDKNFISVNASAEETGLENNSVDFIIAGQAFHWFDLGKSKSEFRRILKKDGYFFIIWNSRIFREGFMDDYDDLLLMKFGTDYDKVNHENIDEEVIRGFFSPNEFSVRKFYIFQEFDFEGLKGRLLSSSYVPNADDPASAEMLIALEKLFDRYNINGKVKMEYDTVVYFGRL